MSKKSGSLSPNLQELLKKFSKNDVIEEMEKEYQSVAAKKIPLALVDDNSYFRRVQIPQETILQMGKGIQEKGLWNPLLVRPSGSHYELVLGRKRYYGAKAASLSEVPCVIKEVSDEEMLLMPMRKPWPKRAKSRLPSPIRAFLLKRKPLRLMASIRRKNGFGSWLKA